jgi:hypothetical protein
VALAACVSVVAPQVARAALSLGIQPDLSCAPGEHYFDLVFTETAPAENEGLFAYDLALSYVPVGIGTGAGGFTFTGAAAPPDRFVFDGPAGAMFGVSELTPSRVVMNVVNNGDLEDLVDIQTGDKAARIFYTIGPTPPAAYTLAFDTAGTDFTSADPNHSIDIAVALSDPGVVVCPEPGGVIVLSVAGAFALARRRRR